MTNIIYGSTLQEIAANLDFLGDYPKQYHLKYKPGQVYYIRLEFPFTTWYKLGYTSRDLKTRFYGTYDYKARRNRGGMGIPKGVKLKTIDKLVFDTAYDAFLVEQAIHNLHQKERSYGLTMLKNGNSELYKRDILGLDPTYSRPIKLSI